MTNAAKNSVGTTFTERYNEVTKEIEFDPKWANGTGYYDHAVKMVKLEPGEVAKSFDAGTGRRLIFIGTRFGTIVAFDRYSNQSENGVYTTNEPDCFTIKQFLLQNGSLDDRAIRTLLGYWDIKNNLGVVIQKIAEEMAD